MNIGDLYWIRDNSLDWKMKGLLLKIHPEHPTFCQFHILSVEIDEETGRDRAPFSKGQNGWIDSNSKDVTLTIIQSMVE